MHLIRIGLIVMAVMVLSTAIHSSPVFGFDGKKGILRVQFSQMAPWKQGEKGKERGVDIEFMRLLAERMDLDVEFVHVPFARGLDCAKKGTLDLLTGVLRRPEREKYLHFIEPAYNSHSPKAFYVRKEDSKSITMYRDLYGLRIGTIIGAKYFRKFDLDTRLRKEPVRNAKLNFKKLLNHRIDVAIVSETSADKQLRTLGLQEKIVKSRYKSLQENHVYMVLSKQSPFAPRLKEFNAHMKALLEEHAREEIKKKYSGMTREFFD